MSRSLNDFNEYKNSKEFMILKFLRHKCREDKIDERGYVNIGTVANFMKMTPLEVIDNIRNEKNFETTFENGKLFVRAKAMHTIKKVETGKLFPQFIPKEQTFGYLAIKKDNIHGSKAGTIISPIADRKYTLLSIVAIPPSNTHPEVLRVDLTALKCPIYIHNDSYVVECDIYPSMYNVIRPIQF